MTIFYQIGSKVFSQALNNHCTNREAFITIQRQVLAGSQLQTSDIHNESTQNSCASHSTNTDLNEVTNEASLLIEWYQKTPGRPIHTCGSTSVSQ